MNVRTKKPNNPAKDKKRLATSLKTKTRRVRQSQSTGTQLNSEMYKLPSMKFEIYVHRDLEKAIKPIRTQIKKMGVVTFTPFRTIPTKQTLKKTVPTFIVLPITTILELSKKNAQVMMTDFMTWMNQIELKYPKNPPICLLTYRKPQLKRLGVLPYKENFIFIEETLFNAFPLFSQLLSREIMNFNSRKALVKLERVQMREKIREQRSDLKTSEEELISKEILNIGLNISKERDTVKILEEILSNSMRITHADAGSIAIRGMDKNLKKTDKELLTFYISKNISRDLHFNRFSMIINEKSLGGYTVLTGELLNIEDAYLISSKKSYSFNREFDEKTNFRTKSILVVPMINQKDETIGIIQLINKKEEYLKKINYENFPEKQVESFTKEDEVRLTAFASLATISLQNAILYNEIDNLFHSFVEASVSAVEQRDPATSGHSFRVSRFSSLLAESCNNSGGFFDDWHFSKTQLRELEYASLLHDFGKIGVRENVLLKSHKIEVTKFSNLLRKFDIIILNTQLKSYQETVDLFREGTKHGTPLLELEEKIDRVKEKWQRKIDEFRHYRTELERCNEGGPINDDLKNIIEECSFLDVDGVFFKEKLITNQEELFLSIPYGTLSNSERIEIQSHVSLTFEFLKKIPWTEELRHIPEIAHFHHEKLDGSGYPIGIKADSIPNQTKIMTICDIYDALTSADRPYKKSMDHDRAISILKSESEMGKLHPDLLELFIRNKLISETVKLNRPSVLKEIL